jgi:hypothetical protein
MMVNCTETTKADGTAGSGAGMVVIAILCVVCSSLTTTFGLFFQKIAQERFAFADEHPESIPKADRKSFNLKTKLIWFAGFLNITLFSFGLDLFSMATLGQAMVVPLLASLEVAENQMAAPCMLKEKFDKVRDTAAAIIITLGALSTTLFGPGGPFAGDGAGTTAPVDACGNPIVPNYVETKENFGVLFGAPAFIVFEIVTIFLFITCLVLINFEKQRKLHFLFYGYIAGFLGGQQNMFLKGVGTFFGLGFSGNVEVFADWMVYVFIIMMAGLAGTQMGYLNRGLALFPALLFVPTYTVIYIVMGTCVGMVFYQEYKLMTTLGWIMFCIGFMLIFAALTILATKEIPEEEVENDAPLDQPSPKKSSSVPKRHSLHNAILGVLFVVHHLDDEHPANSGISEEKRLDVHGKSIKQIKSKTNTHIMVGLGGGLITSHRVMRNDLKIKGHLPKIKFKGAVKAIIMTRRMSAHTTAPVGTHDIVMEENAASVTAKEGMGPA